MKRSAILLSALVVGGAVWEPAQRRSCYRQHQRQSFRAPSLIFGGAVDTSVGTYAFLHDNLTGISTFFETVGNHTVTPRTVTIVFENTGGVRSATRSRPGRPVDASGGAQGGSFSPVTSVRRRAPTSWLRQRAWPGLNIVDFFALMARLSTAAGHRQSGRLVKARQRQQFPRTFTSTMVDGELQVFSAPF